MNASPLCHSFPSSCFLEKILVLFVPFCGYFIGWPHLSASGGRRHKKHRERFIFAAPRFGCGWPRCALSWLFIDWPQEGALLRQGFAGQAKSTEEELNTKDPAGSGASAKGPAMNAGQARKRRTNTCPAKGRIQHPTPDILKTSFPGGNA